MPTGGASKIPVARNNACVSLTNARSSTCNATPEARALAIAKSFYRGTFRRTNYVTHFVIYWRVHDRLRLLSARARWEHAYAPFALEIPNDRAFPATSPGSRPTHQQDGISSTA
jgi:hypothetical protein